MTCPEPYSIGGVSWHTGHSGAAQDRFSSSDPHPAGAGTLQALPVTTNTRMRPRLNTVVARVDLFNLHPMVAIKLHCIPTVVVEMQPK